MFHSDISEEQIRRKIAGFRDLAEKGISDAECVTTISSIFGNVYSFPTEVRTYSQGTAFFRARAIPNHDTKLPLETIRKVGDAWEPPAHVVRVQGRLNGMNHSILYCAADDPHLAIDEARARGNKHVAIIVYKSLRPLKVAVLGDYDNSNLPKDSKSKLFFSFLEEEFSRFVPPGEEGRYSITRTIADTFFSYPEQDAWRYRSVQSPDKFNVAFLAGRSRACLDLVGVMICETTSFSHGPLRVKCVVDFDERTGDARYHRIGSEEQRKIFPEIASESA